jgi:hypothetical protein
MHYIIWKNRTFPALELPNLSCTGLEPEIETGPLLSGVHQRRCWAGHIWKEIQRRASGQRLQHQMGFETIVRSFCQDFQSPRVEAWLGSLQRECIVAHDVQKWRHASQSSREGKCDPENVEYAALLNGNQGQEESQIRDVEGLE